MPPLTSLTRTFPIALNHATKAPALLSITLVPRTSHPMTPSALFSTTKTVQSGDSHESPYDPPSGWLFGVPPGEKYKNEGWEKIWVWGFWGSLGLATVAYAYKPDSSIQTWALEEARRRLEAEGILPDPSSTGDSSKPS